ncbi:MULTISPECIES: D-glycerate dehydrogenase [Acidiplasma]|jgi:glyoxylate reductase/gluconate 2-dehydrogenase|uniref:2-hydroxyacid dehydrogenase n=1 Tax=Acidiplasma TaxID=507753 RepID=UPI0005DCB371|nr:MULTISPECIES: D-glycerate dehydrogenase [unclassified Acidiplasma]KJE48750.1 2-ketogluconate reductase [Acidiplasma sp. MBA-1]WMT55574.1 MAG: D-glycerate dehydrogenase [Acidiplasma sp.]
MYNVLVTHDLPGNYIDSINGINIIRRPESEDANAWLLKNIENADGILITLNEKIDKNLIDLGKKLKVISTYSVGYDHIDVDYALKKGIKIGYTPEVLTETTADLIFGIMLAAARRIVEGDKIVRENKWKSGWNPEFMLGAEVHGATAGILGMGRIGNAILRRARGFNMDVIYYSRHKHDVDANFMPLDDVLRNSDFLFICLDYNKDTYHFMDMPKFKKMKKTAFIINGTRGKVINEKDLISALNSGIIAGAALDVFETEPIDNNNPLLKMNNVVLTPHIGSATDNTRKKMAEVAVSNLINGLSGKPLIYAIKK